MTFEELEKASKKQLRCEVVNRFNLYNEHRPSGIEYLWEAQFYMTELDRRHDSWVSLRDLILELMVIGLIGWEISMGYQQDAVMKNLQSSSASTAATLAAINGTTVSMNRAAQRQSGALLDASVDVYYDRNSIVVTNTGRQILILGRYGFQGRRLTKPEYTQTLERNQSFQVGRYWLQAELERMNAIDDLIFVAVVKLKDGTEYEARTPIHFSRADGVLNASCETTTLTRRDWTMPKK